MIEIYREGEQGSGEFDGGKITEIKPIPFPQEEGGSKRIGPLLYWAWATAQGDGVIGMHPHRGFEIMSYVLEGEVGHSDSGGNRRKVGAGGAQVMQTGSGISHEEEMFGERTDFFQIWFEPDLKEALKAPPRYGDFEEEAFPVDEVGEGVRVKRVIDNGGPVEIETEAVVEDVRLDAGARYEVPLAENRALAVVVIEGGGVLAVGGGEEREIARRDFAVVKAEDGADVKIAAGEGGARLLTVEVPLVPDYPLYSER